MSPEVLVIINVIRNASYPEAMGTNKVYLHSVRCQTRRCLFRI